MKIQPTKANPKRTWGQKCPPPMLMRVNIRENQIKMKRAYEIRCVYLGIGKQLGEKTQSFAWYTKLNSFVCIPTM